MNNDNLNNLKEQIRSIYDDILALQLPEKEDDSVLNQKLGNLLSNTQEIMRQNEKIISQNEVIKSLIGQLMERPLSIETKNDEVRQEEKEPLQIFVLPEENLEQIKETSQEDEKPVEQVPLQEQIAVEPKQENSNSQQENTELKQDFAEPQQEKLELKQESVEPQQEEIKPLQEEKHEEKNETSSVLEFLHKRVIKDNPSKSISDIKSKDKKEESVTSALNSLFADSETEEVAPKTEKTATLFDTKEEKDKADILSDKQESIGDRFASQTKNDLRVAIGINYKFMFINDLFSGDIKEYENFINQLNKTTSFKDSMEVINNKRLSYKWAATSPAYANLVDIIQKRFE